MMQRIASRYVRRHQRRLHTTGHLFERRYGAWLVDVDEYLLELVRYSHLDPVRAGMVRHPAEYEWSSHLTYLGTRSQPWLCTDFVVRMFHEDADKAASAIVHSSWRASPAPAMPRSIKGMRRNRACLDPISSSRRSPLHPFGLVRARHSTTSQRPPAKPTASVSRSCVLLVNDGD